MRAELGSISHGTLRQPDLLNAFADTLAGLDDHFDDTEAKALATLLEIDSDYCAGLPEAAAAVLDDLADRLQEFAPPYCYFGAHSGDGSDFGFWPNLDAIDELPKVSDPNEVDDIGQDCVFVNDHGNVTLYAADGSILWDCV